jgi:nucleotide-binding universal stress UspA family protein
MIRRILVALDASPRALPVFDEAVELARKFGAELLLLRVVDIPSEFPAAAAWGKPDDLRKTRGTEARADLLRMARRAPDVKSGCRVEASSQAWRVIIGASDELGADLIVMGSHGYHGVDRILGTTAAKVSNLARQSILIVHTRSGHDRPLRDPDTAIAI